MAKRKESVVKKQFAIILLIFSFCIALTSCGGKDNTSENSKNETSNSTPMTTTISTTTTPPTQTEPTPTTTTTTGNNRELASRILTTARSLLGTPFAMNQADPVSGFDNSGFIYYVLKQNNVLGFPRVVGEQVKIGTKISVDKMQSGDLVFFWSDDSSTPTFGGIYAGNGKMIACLSEGDVVSEVDISSGYYKEHFYTATVMG